MSETGGGWPQDPGRPQGPRIPQDPRIPQGPRLPEDRRPQGPRGYPPPDQPAGPGRLPGGDWRPEDQLGPLPPEPVHHEPWYGDRHPSQDDSPWRRSQRLSQPVQASYDADARGGEPYQEYEPYQEHQYGEPYPAEDEYDSGSKFVPGFGVGGTDDDGAAPARHRTRRSGGRRSRRRRLRWLAPLAALLIILVPLAVGGAYAYRLYMNRYHPPDYPGSGTGYLVVQVPSDASATSLGPKLQQLGVVASARAFVLAAEHSTNPNGLLPGFYGMREHMEASLAYALLLNPKNLVQVPVTIPEGWRLSQIVSWLGVKSGIPAAAYEQVLKDPARLGLPASANGNPEGYLFPATYEVVPHETAFGILKGMVQRFDQEAAAINLPAAASQVHLSPGQVITMASLVQAEGGRLSDYPKIARVIYNRLQLGMLLQLDSTVLYGLNTYGILATDQQLTSSSPYNTYRYKGLPPGPIDSPGNAAIQAVLHPASGNWIYFVTVNPKTKQTLFTSSPAQFAQYRQELQRNLGQG